MAYTASITRLLVPGGPLAALALVSDDYDIVNFGPGALSWRKQTAEAQWVHGRVMTAAVKDVEVAPLEIEVYGSSSADLDANTRALLDAFEQWTYDLTVVADGVTHTWRCEPADYAPSAGRRSGAYEHFSLVAGAQAFQAYTFQIPRHPVPVAGSM